eukprot:1325297-Prymnesium_polylepis.1
MVPSFVWTTRARAYTESSPVSVNPEIEVCMSASPGVALVEVYLRETARVGGVVEGARVGEPRVDGRMIHQVAKHGVRGLTAVAGVHVPSAR